MNYIEDTDLEQMDKLIEYYRDVANKAGFKSVWSMWTTSEWIDMNDVSGIPEGTMIRHSDRWGKITKAIIKDKYWFNVWAACDEAIVVSGDTQNVFIEDFMWTTIEQEDGTVEKFLDVVTGS